MTHRGSTQCYRFHSTVSKADHFPITACSAACYSSYTVLFERQSCVELIIIQEVSIRNCYSNGFFHSHGNTFSYPTYIKERFILWESHVGGDCYCLFGFFLVIFPGYTDARMEMNTCTDLQHSFCRKEINVFASSFCASEQKKRNLMNWLLLFSRALLDTGRVRSLRSIRRCGYVQQNLELCCAENEPGWLFCTLQ